MQRGFARALAVFSAFTLSCGSAHAGMLDSLLNGRIPIPVPGVGSFRVSQGQRSPAQQTPRMVAGRIYNEGVQLSRMNQLQESRMKFEQAIRIDPSFEMAWAALVGACMTSGQLEEGIAVGDQFIASFPHSSRRQETELILQKLHEQLDKKNEIYQRVGRDGADNYFGLATEGKNFYGWNLNAMPLKVFISDGHGVRGYNRNDATILNNSFAEWTLATDSRITFTKVDSLEEANIECVWIDDPKDFPQNRGMEAGEAVPLLDSDGYIVHSKLYLLTRNRKDSKPVDDLVMHTVCLHEIGHTLGLLGHSDNPSDVMYFTANGQRVQEPHLTQRDVNTLAKLYAKILDSRNSTASSKTSRSELATESTTVSADSVVALPAEPGKQQPYANGKRFASNQDAIDYFERASAKAPNDPAILDDLGTAYDNYGIELANQNDMFRAEKYFNLAYSIHRNSSDRNKLRNTVANFMQLLHYEKRDSEAARLGANVESVTASGN